MKRVGRQVGEVPLLVVERVIVVEVVEADDGVAAGEEGLGESAADEAGGAGDEHFHGGVLRAEGGARQNEGLPA